MEMRAKIYFKNITNHTDNENLKTKKILMIDDLLFLPNVKSKNHLLNKYKFEDKSMDKVYKKYQMNVQEWNDLLSGKNIDEVFGEMEDFKILSIEDRQHIYKDYYNYFNEILINEVDYVLLEMYEI